MRRLEDGNFAVVVYDPIWGCSLLLAMKLNTKAVMSNPMSAVGIISSQIGNPLNLAVTPEAMTAYTNRMSFFQVEACSFTTLKGEASPSIYADWLNGWWFLKPNSFGQIWIIQSRAMIFQRFY